MTLPIGWIPFFGDALETLNLMVWLGLVLVAALTVFLFRTPQGLRLRSVGENPLAADTAGISPITVRYRAVIASGVLAAMGGVFLSIGFVHSFNQNMTAGRGFIALAAVIFGKWRPGGALAAALLFGFSSALAQRLPVFSPEHGDALPGAAVRAHADRRGRHRRALAAARRRRDPLRALIEPGGWPSPACASRAPARRASGALRRVAAQVSDEVELYHRTYTTLLRSSGETLLRVLEPSHRSMTSSLHALAGSDELDLGAFLYAIRRLPDAVSAARVIIMGQEAEVFARHGIGPLDEWTPLEAPARRRRWYDDGQGTMAVLLASASDLDDLIPTLVAYQIEWNKLRVRLRTSDWPPDGGDVDAGRVRRGARRHGRTTGCSSLETWGEDLRGPHRRGGRRAAQPAHPHAGRQRRRLRAHDAPLVGAGARRRWPSRRSTTARCTSSPPTRTRMANLVSGTARRREDELTSWVETDGPDDLRTELAAFRDGRTDGSWENFLYFSARDFFEAQGAELKERRSEEERAVGITHISSRTALRVSAQVIALDRLDPRWLDPRLGDVDADRLSRCPAVIVNIEYPLGLAAYNILREITEAHDTLRGVYVLGKAATLNADVGDVMISSVIHDEHSGSTYWLDNAFSVSDIAPYLMFGSGLDNQRAVTVKSTFLQNREYLDFYYREAFTVVEMEAGPYCNAVYEIADVDRYPVGEAVNFSKLPIDFGIIHYASDTPYTQARTLGARGLSYYGMDSTYASSLAILRRVLDLEGLLTRGR